MENDIYKIYHNTFGIAFKWKISSETKRQDKIQLVFRDMGFYLSEREIKTFYSYINQLKGEKACSCCANEKNTKCILLKTPSEKVDIAVNLIELKQLKDLIRGTLFQLSLNQLITDICRN